MSTRIVPFKDGMKIGLGYNRLTGDHRASPAVQGTGISAIQGAGGLEVKVDCTTIKDVETLHKKLGISIDAGGSYMGFSGSAKVDYCNTCDFSSFSNYVVVRVSVKAATDTIDSPTFSDDAKELLINNNPDRFRQRFGDAFIAGVLKGGEYFAIYQITSSEEKERTDVAVNVHAAFKGLIASAELNTSIKTATEKSKSHLEVQVHVFRQGAIGIADLNLEDIMKTAREFPVGVSGDRAFPFAVLLEAYDALKNPNDQFVYVDIQHQQEVLEELAKKRFEFLELRDDLKYILKHSDDFQNADGSSVDRDKISNDFDEVVDAINTMQDEASICTRDATKCEFSKFEVAKFDLPRWRRSEGLKLVANPHSFPHNVERILFDVPDNFQATVKLTVDWVEPVAAGFGRPGMYMSARAAGIGLLRTDGKSFGGAAIRTQASGVEVGNVGGELDVDRMFDYVGTPYVGSTVYLRITVENRRIRKRAEFSSDGQIFAQLAGTTLGRSRSPLGPECKLALFAWSRDDTPVKVEFSAPTIVPTTT